MSAGYVYDPIYLKHDTGQHVENAQRLEAIISHLEKTGLKKQLTLIEPRPATVEEIALVHQKKYIKEIEDLASQGGGWLDPDTVMSPGSYEAALYAAGGVMRALAAVMAGEVDSAFALVRPPGHHATAERAMGFCLFNNIAIAAKYALAEYKLERILIIDFDVHHGNGTQEAFYDNPQVMYISTHQYPFYPGSGDLNESGGGAAEGTTINIPLPAGCGDGEYLAVFEKVIVPAARRFQPQLILVSAGYDNHWADPLALMEVSVSGFAKIAGVIKGLADELCRRRLVFTLEGGYNLDALAASVKATLDVLLGKSGIDDPLGPSPRHFKVADIGRLIEAVKAVHGLG
ncbi:MAG TPA: histone deacetylase [Dehalococcoidia bacterium]|nr:histone deacetylase [Dehalococcoidia bacterium]